MGVENNIPEGWIEVNIAEIATTNDESISRDYNHLNIEYLDTGSITKNSIEGFQLFDLKEAPSRAKRLVKNGDIIYSTVRPNQEHYGYINNPKANCVVSTGFCVIRTKDTCYSKFLYHLLTQNKVRDYLHILGEQSASAYPSIKPIDIENLIINIPGEINEQKAIAKVLTAFDDKIELLQAQNNTLETMTQTIFKEWFGKYQIEDELPKGWRVGKLGDIAKHVKNNIKPFNNPNKLYHHYSLPAYDDGLRPVNELGSDIKSNKYSVENNSFLVSKLNPFTPRIWTIFNSEDVNICSTEFQVVKPNEDNLFSIIHCLLNSKHFTSNLSQKVKGTSSSHQRVNPEDIFEVDLIIPK